MNVRGSWDEISRNGWGTDWLRACGPKRFEDKTNLTGAKEQIWNKVHEFQVWNLKKAVWKTPSGNPKQLKKSSKVHLRDFGKGELWPSVYEQGKCREDWGQINWVCVKDAPGIEVKTVFSEGGTWEARRKPAEHNNPHNHRNIFLGGRSAVSNAMAKKRKMRQGQRPWTCLSEVTVNPCEKHFIEVVEVQVALQGIPEGGQGCVSRCD